MQGKIFENSFGGLIVLSYLEKLGVEIDNVKIKLEDLPQEHADDNDTLLRQRLPNDLRKLYVLTERSIKNFEEVVAKIEHIRWQIKDMNGNIVPGANRAIVNDLRGLRKSACLLKARNDFLSSAFELALWDYFKIECYKFKVCVDWGVVLCGEEEKHE